MGDPEMLARIEEEARQERRRTEATEAENKRLRREFREELLGITMARRNCDRAEAEVILARMAARLDGHSHSQAEAMHPLPAARGVSGDG